MRGPAGGEATGWKSRPLFGAPTPTDCHAQAPCVAGFYHQVQTGRLLQSDLTDNAALRPSQFTPSCFPTSARLRASSFLTFPVDSTPYPNLEAAGRPGIRRSLRASPTAGQLFDPGSPPLGRSKDALAPNN